MSKPVGFYTKDDKVRPISKRRPHIRPLASGTANLGIPKRTVQQIHANRSRKARQVDEAMKARLAKSEEEWAGNPNKLDLKGVDYLADVKTKDKYHTTKLISTNRHSRGEDKKMDAAKIASELETNINPKLFSYPFRGAKVEKADEGRMEVAFFDKRDFNPKLDDPITTIHIDVYGRTDPLEMTKLSYNTRVAIQKAIEKTTFKAT